MKLFEVFHQISFFSAQLVSARRLLALFPLRKFCSVANLNINCFAWLVCLKFLFDKDSYYESVWDWVLNANFLSMERPPSVSCACMLP